MIPFFFLYGWTEFLLCAHQVFITRSSAEGHPGCFHFLAIVKEAAVSMAKQGSMNITPSTPGANALPQSWKLSDRNNSPRHEKPPSELLARKVLETHTIAIALGCPLSPQNLKVPMFLKTSGLARILAESDLEASFLTSHRTSRYYASCQQRNTISCSYEAYESQQWPAQQDIPKCSTAAHISWQSPIAAYLDWRPT